jgi:YD repeat-containing protein
MKLMSIGNQSEIVVNKSVDFKKSKKTDNKINQEVVKESADKEHIAVPSSTMLAVIGAKLPNDLNKMITKYPDNTIIEETYDENNNVIKTLYAEPNGKFKETSFEYDDNGNLVKETSVDSYGYTYEVSNVYDELGRVTETAYSDSRGNTSVTNSSYDKNGNLAEETVKEFHTRKTTFSYGKDALN